MLKVFKKKKELSFMEKAIIMLERDEGKRNKPYRCTAGKLTIGIGRNLEDVGLYDDEIYYLLQNDIKRKIKSVKTLFPEYDDFTEAQKLALLNMNFNMGVGTLSKFKNTIKMINSGLWEKARKNALLSLWAKQVKSRSKRVTDLFVNKIGYKFGLSNLNKK